MRVHAHRGLLAVLPFLVGIACSARSHADTVNAAVAANFGSAIKRLAPAFEARTGHTLVASFGASGQFYAQIRNGAPFDVFLSADMATPRRLAGEGGAVADTLFVYARGRLVLWSATPGLVDAEGEVLRKMQFARLSIANPKTAPYGQASIETLRALGLLERVQPLLVTGENIAQAQQFVASGNVPLGLIALGQVMALPPTERGSYWMVPATLHAPIEQGAVLLSAAKNPAAARAFLAFLTTPEATAIVQALGYETPAATAP
jgi:molybdate transport system substrate-binding protein